MGDAHGAQEVATNVMGMILGPSKTPKLIESVTRARVWLVLVADARKRQQAATNTMGMGSEPHTQRAPTAQCTYACVPAQVADARERQEAATNAMEVARSDLMRAIRERYTEEQLWSDKIRRASTW